MPIVESRAYLHPAPCPWRSARADVPALSSGLQGLGQRAGRVQGLGVQGLVDQGLGVQS